MTAPTATERAASKAAIEKDLPYLPALVVELLSNTFHDYEDFYMHLNSMGVLGHEEAQVQLTKLGREGQLEGTEKLAGFFAHKLKMHVERLFPLDTFLQAPAQRGLPAPAMQGQPLVRPPTEPIGPSATSQAVAKTERAARPAVQPPSRPAPAPDATRHPALSKLLHDKENNLEALIALLPADFGLTTDELQKGLIGNFAVFEKGQYTKIAQALHILINYQRHRKNQLPLSLNAKLFESFRLSPQAIQIRKAEL